jgi:hypothetical protein
MTEDKARYTLTKVESKELPGRILAALVEAKAQGKRLTGAQLAKRFGYREDRKIRVAIGELLLKGYLILSSVRSPRGYFLADSKRDVDTYVATEHSRIREQYARIKQVQINAQRTIKQYEQVPLALED